MYLFCSDCPCLCTCPGDRGMGIVRTPSILKKNIIFNYIY